MIVMSVSNILFTSRDSGEVFVFGCVYYDVTIFVTVVAVREHGFSNCYQTVKIDQQWHWTHDVNFTRWQHPTVGAG